MGKTLLLLLLILFPHMDANAQDSDTAKVYVLKIFSEIGSTSWVHTQAAFGEAETWNADCILLHLNTYGGQVVFADSMRTKILNSRIPVYVFIDNNAASAGALISIACDSIYMRPGANIGAATVVDQSGQQMPDKYQSYMRSTIRATAEAHGKDTLVVGRDTTYRWHRDPHIAEAMVDASIAIAGITDSGKVVTFTTQEAIKHGFCEGSAESIQEVLSNQIKLKHFEIKTFEPSFYDGLKGWLTSPVLQGILILVILGGIYFELQTPGIGFPLLAAAVAAVLYFAPLYLEGLAANWEILLFLIGVILVAVEIFVLPGFGIAGVSGTILIVTGLAFSMLNNHWFDFSGVTFTQIITSFSVVMTGLIGGIILLFLLSKYILEHDLGPFARVALHTTQNVADGYIGIDTSVNQKIGALGVAETDLRPSGKISIDEEWFDAISEQSYIEKGTPVEVVSYSAGQVVVRKITDSRQI